MNTSMRKRSIVALLAAGSLVAVAPVAAQAHYGPVGKGPQVGSNADSGEVVLRRDGTKSTTFVADVSLAPVLRRDGSEATTFVADVGPQPVLSRAGTKPTSGDGLDGGSAAVGAAVGLLIAAAVAAGSTAIRGRPAHAPAPSTPASQGV